MRTGPQYTQYPQPPKLCTPKLGQGTASKSQSQRRAPRCLAPRPATYLMTCKPASTNDSRKHLQGTQCPPKVTKQPVLTLWTPNSDTATQGSLAVSKHDPLLFASPSKSAQTPGFILVAKYSFFIGQADAAQTLICRGKRPGSTHESRLAVPGA